MLDGLGALSTYTTYESVPGASPGLPTLLKSMLDGVSAPALRTPNTTYMYESLNPLGALPVHPHH